MDVSSTLDIDINVLDTGVLAGGSTITQSQISSTLLDTGIMVGPSTIKPVYVSNDGVFGSQVGVQYYVFC
jgi:hypothetical protein